MLVRIVNSLYLRICKGLLKSFEAGRLCKSCRLVYRCPTEVGAATVCFDECSHSLHSIRRMPFELVWHLICSWGIRWQAWMTVKPPGWQSWDLRPVRH